MSQKKNKEEVRSGCLVSFEDRKYVFSKINVGNDGKVEDTLRENIGNVSSEEIGFVVSAGWHNGENEAIYALWHNCMGWSWRDEMLRKIADEPNG